MYVTLFFSSDRQDFIEIQNPKGQNRDCQQVDPSCPVEWEGEKVPQGTRCQGATDCQQH